MDTLALVAGLLFLVPATLHDMRTREVPDLVSYGLVILGVALGLARALMAGSWLPVLRMLAGLGTMALLALLFYYAGQWGGADTKLLIGMGALLGLGFGTWDALLFLVLLLLGGALYGLLFTVHLIVRAWPRFRKGFVALLRERAVHRLRIVVVIACFLLFAAILVAPPAARPAFPLAAVAVYLLFYVGIVIKAVERSVLTKRYPVGRLTEGDWIVNDVVVKGKRICGPKDLGISREQIAELRRLKVRSVLVKEGIPFVPSFLLALVLLWLLGPWLAALLAAL